MRPVSLDKRPFRQEKQMSYTKLGNTGIDDLSPGASHFLRT